MNVLVMMAKYPEVGKVKTRLAASIGEQKATTVYAEILQLLIAEHTNQSYDFLIYTAPDAVLMQRWSGVLCKPQGGGHHGDRIRRIFEQELPHAQKVIIIGGDAPDVTHTIVEQAFDQLDHHDVVIGPAMDGGYYLIGMKQLHDLFTDISWSTEHVFSQTMQRAHGLTVAKLQTLRDIDTVDDYNAWRKQS
jgi:hypothetical protein